MFDEADITRLHDQQTIGHWLKKLRRAAGFTALDAGHRTFIHPARLARIEQGRLLPRQDELEVLLREYDASQLDSERLQQLLDERLENPLVLRFTYNPESQSGFDYQKNFWTKFVDPYNQFHCFETTFVAGFFQIRPYMERVITRAFELNEERASFSDWEVNQIEMVVDLRLKWQKVLYETKRKFKCVLKESILQNQLCEAPIMSAQCRHLMQMSHLPNIDIRVLPTNSPSFKSGDFWVVDEEFVHLETDARLEILRSKRQVNLHMKYFNQLQGAALTNEASRELIAKYVDFYSTNPSHTTIDLRDTQTAI